MGNSGAPDELYRNEGSGSFTLVLGTSISQYNSDTRAVVVLDMDNDGDVRKMPRVDETPAASPRHCFCSLFA